MSVAHSASIISALLVHSQPNRTECCFVCNACLQMCKFFHSYVTFRPVFAFSFIVRYVHVCRKNVLEIASSIITMKNMKQFTAMFRADQAMQVCLHNCECARHSLASCIDVCCVLVYCGIMHCNVRFCCAVHK